MPRIRTIVDEELESVWTGRKPHSRRWIPWIAGISCCVVLRKRANLSKCIGCLMALYQAYSVCRPDKGACTAIRHFEKEPSCHHSVRCSARAGCRIYWLPRSWLSPLFSFIWPAGESAVVFAAKRRSVCFQPICRAGEFCRAFRQLLSRRLLDDD